MGKFKLQKLLSFFSCKDNEMLTLGIHVYKLKFFPDQLLTEMVVNL